MQCFYLAALFLDPFAIVMYDMASSIQGGQSILLFFQRNMIERKKNSPEVLFINFFFLLKILIFQ